MALTRIPYRNTGYFSSLICDLIEGHPDLESQVSAPVRLEEFEKQIALKMKYYSLSTRKTLVKALRAQYQGLSSTKKVEAKLSLLAKETTFTVTTGHQLNLFTGPLYFFYKIISTIKLCKQLKQKYPQFDFVPIYWMATEDHDFEEISYFFFQGKKLQWNEQSQGPVGRLSLASLGPLLNIFEKLLGDSDRAKEIKAIIQKTYRTAANLADATQKLVHHFFGEEGLVILDADRKNLKTCFVPQIKNDLERHHCKDTVEETITKIKTSYSDKYTPQVNPREVNLFYLTDKLRERIVKTDTAYATSKTNKTFTKEALWAEVENHPEYFSPNVLMRPLYQEVILPNLCYIGGGGEIAYWLELKSYFKKERVPFPLLLLRNSAVLATQKTERKIKQLDLEKEELFLKRTALINKKIRQISNIDLDLQFLKEKLEEQFEYIESLIESTDPSFKGTVKAQKQKQFNGIDTLEKRLLNAQKKKLVDHVQRLTLLHEMLFPNNSLQERQSNFFEFYLSHGEDLLPLLFEQLDPLKLEFSWIQLPK
jgi:bacillithiol synthase